MLTLRPIVLVLAVVCTLGAACSSDDEGPDASGADSPSEAPKATGGTLRIALPVELDTLDPFASSQWWSLLVSADNVGQTMTITNGQGPPAEPSLATSWEQTSPTTWRFDLREGVEFHNGEPFNAEAVKFTVDHVLDPETEIEESYFANVDGASVVDEYTVEIETSINVPDLDVLMSFMPIVPPAYTTEDPTALDSHPVGTGPYEFVSRSTDEVRLRRFDGYWDSPAFWDEVVLLARPEASQRVAGLQADEIDLAYTIPLEQVGQVPASVSVPALEGTHLLLNAFGGATQNERIREAVVLATDNASVAESFFDDEFELMRCQFVAEGITGFNAELEAQEFDPDAARDLLAEVGENPSLRFVVPAGSYAYGEEIAQVFANQLEDVGFQVDLHVVPFATYIDEITIAPPSQRAEVILFSADYYQFSAASVYSSYIPEPSGEGVPVPAYPTQDDPEIQDLLSTAVADTEADRRTEALEEIALRFCDRSIIDFSHAATDVYGVASGIDFEPRGDRRLYFDEIRPSG